MSKEKKIVKVKYASPDGKNFGEQARVCETEMEVKITIITFRNEYNEKDVHFQILLDDKVVYP